MGSDARPVAPTPNQGILLHLLERVCGSHEAANSILRYGLVRAGLASLPDPPDEVLSFVRAYLLGPLSAEVGPRSAMGFVDDLTEQIEQAPPSGVRCPTPPPSSAHGVARLSIRQTGAPTKGLLLLVDGDAFRRASLARTIVQGRWDVRTAQSVEQVLDSVTGEERPDAVVVDLDHPSVEPIVRAVVAQLPEAAILLRGDEARAPSSLRSIGRVGVCSRDAPLLDRVEAMMAGLPRP